MPPARSSGKWHAWDHLIQDRDPTKANYGPVSAHPELIDLNYPPPGRVGSGINDWMHSNAVTYNARLDQVMISVRHFNELWIIDHSTTSAEAAGHTGGRSGRGGDILYRWGNPEAYRAGSPGDRQLFEQHDTQWIDHDLPGGGNILVFDNGLERPSPAFSRVVEITPPTPDTRGNYPRPTPNWGPALPTWTFQAPGFYSMFVGGAQRLPNGNTLVCSGWQGVSFEVTPQGRIVWKYVCPMRSTPLLQGSVPASNQMFRTPRYAPGYAAFAGRNLTAGDPIERQDTVLLADGSSTQHVVTAGTRVSLAVRSAADGGRIYFVATSATSGADRDRLAVPEDRLRSAAVHVARPHQREAVRQLLRDPGRRGARGGDAGDPGHGGSERHRPALDVLRVRPRRARWHRHDGQ
jgi:hypothetical protein